VKDDDAVFGGHGPTSTAAPASVHDGVSDAGAKPSQRSTGRRGYFGKRGSCALLPQSTNVEPFPEVTVRAWAHQAQSPLGGSAPLSCAEARLNRTRSRLDTPAENVNATAEEVSGRLHSA